MPNQSSVAVALTIMDDDIAEPPESFQVRVEAEIPVINVVSAQDIATITILDNEGIAMPPSYS